MIEADDVLAFFSRFALDAHDAAHARMLAARACQIYLPASIPDASIELYAVLR